MALISKNPATEEVLKTYEELSDKEIVSALEKAQNAYEKWRFVPLSERILLVDDLVNALEERKEEITETMTKEMGKPISQGTGEIDKCIMLIRHYCENAESYLAPEAVHTEAKETYIRFDPVGVILAVMPWNFPFWQAIRCIVPNLLAGNTVVLKHASNVPQSSELIQKVFDDTRLPKGVFQNLHISSSKVEQVLRNPIIQGVALTGSTNAGKKVAEVAGSELKKAVMELGGSDPFIILEDADLEAAVKSGVTSRTRNNGQSCNAAKRFLVDESIFDEFIEKFINSFKALKVGDPMDGSTDVGPVVDDKALDEISRIVDESVKMGAKVLIGGKKIKGKGYFYEPTVVLLNESTENVNTKMPLFSEETFGPVATVIIVKNKEHAIEIANNTQFGLGASIWTKNDEVAKEMIEKVEAGSVYINSMVSSDPRTPFGGIKNSGFGREMGREGIREFTNIKTVLVR